jgi:AP-4 complex subunit beta-1
MSLKISYVTNETIIVLKDILRKYKDYIAEFSHFFKKEYLEHITEINGKAAFVWILGEFGEHIKDSPYILEKIIEDEQDNNSIDLHSYLVTSCIRLYFKRAPEMHQILARYFHHVFKNSQDQDLR